MASSRFSLGYRSDIEGLRAVAVILVIAAHAGVSFVPGGFIGVDVFFVLSGYLISGLLIGQRANTGKLNLLEFYLRRFLRLAPALLVMLVVVACVVRVSIAPPAQGEHFLSAAAASLWLSNWHFWSSEIDYFSAALSQNMFLHTWSLSVEEQFYLIWPALILICFAARATRLTNSALVPLCAGMFVIGLLSFAFSVVVSLRDPMAAYYLPMSRAWQFAAGGVALLITYRMRGNLSGITSTDKTRNASDLLDVLGWIGIALIFLSSILIRDTVDYPGFTAIVPTLGTCLVLIAGVKEGRLSIARFLSLRPLVWIGMISYSLYLWHWPSLRILEVFVPAPSALARGVAIAVALGLAVVSYALVETPMRNQKWLLRYPRRLLTASIASVLLVAAFQLTLVGSNQVDSMSPGLDEFRTARNDMPIIYFKQCDTWIESAELTPCRFHHSDGGKEVFFIGDSVGAQWFSAIAAIAKSKQWNLTVHTKSACPLVDIPYQYQRIGAVYAVCDAWRDALMREIQAVEPDIVIMGSSHRYPYTALEWEEGSRTILAELSAVTEQVHVIASTPYLNLNPMECLANVAWREFKLKRSFYEGCAVTTRPDPAGTYAVLAELSTDFSNVGVIATQDLVCPDKRCAVTFQRETEDTALSAPRLQYIFRDRQHLTDSFVQSLTEKLAERLNLNN